MLELSSFLKELHCPFESWTGGAVEQRFRTEEACTMLLDYLVSELMAMKMVHRQGPKVDGSSSAVEMVRCSGERLGSFSKKKNSCNVGNSQSESQTTVALNSIIQNLDLPQPSADVTAKQLFALISERLKLTIPKAGSYFCL